MKYLESRRWSDLFEKEIKRIIGECFLINDISKDLNEATDLMIFTMKPFKFACRVRRHKFLDRYRGEFTFRSFLKSGSKTELSKIADGFGDYFFYGFSNENDNGTGFSQWFIGDLKVFRAFLIKKGRTEGWEKFVHSKMNDDDLTGFASFKLSDLPENFIVHKYGIEVPIYNQKIQKRELEAIERLKSVFKITDGRSEELDVVPF